MPKDDYFRIVFEILKDLYVAKKKAEPVNLILNCQVKCNEVE